MAKTEIKLHHLWMAIEAEYQQNNQAGFDSSVEKKLVTKIRAGWEIKKWKEVKRDWGYKEKVENKRQKEQIIKTMFCFVELVKTFKKKWTVHVFKEIGRWK